MHWTGKSLQSFGSFEGDLIQFFSVHLFQIPNSNRFGDIAQGMKLRLKSASNASRLFSFCIVL